MSTKADEKLPSLNVKIAEALGAVWCQHPLDSEGRAVNAGKPYLAWPDHCFDFEGRPKIPTPPDADEYYSGPEYDTDWSATGPLIEKYGICLITSGYDPLWQASYGEGLSGGWERTPLLAVCKLILALAEAGKL